MIDIHSHLIPGVDDGSQSLEESLSLLKQAEQDGITELITTCLLYTSLRRLSFLHSQPELRAAEAGAAAGDPQGAL